MIYKENISLYSPLPKEKIISQLSSITATQIDNIGTKEFLGTIRNDTFNVYYIWLRDAWNPSISGIIHEDSKHTTIINLEMRNKNVGLLAFTIVYHLMCFFGFVYGISKAQDGDLENIKFVIMSILLALFDITISYIGFKKPIKNTIELFGNIFEARIMKDNDVKNNNETYIED